MSPPNGVNKAAPGNDQPALSPAEERSSLLSLDQLLIDPSNTADPAHLAKKWKDDRDYRLTHIKINEVMEFVTRFMKRDPSISPQKLEAYLKDWYGDPKFKEDPINAVVLSNIRRTLSQMKSADNVEPAQKVVGMLPPVEEPKKEEAPAAKGEKPKESDPSKGALIDPKKNWAFGLSLQNDWVPLKILDFAGIPLSALSTENSYFTVKPSLEFPMGDWVGTVALRGGMFESKGIPGEDGKPGTGYRIGADWGLVNPYSPDHERSGLGFEVTGIGSHAGQATGISAPPPVVRLRFWRQSDWNFPIANNFELGLNTFLNDQETYITLGNDSNLYDNVPKGVLRPEQSPFANTSSLFARTPLRWFNISGRYYFNGRPDRDTAQDLSKPFRPGEGGAKLSNLWTGQIINMNRREDIPAFANTQVLMGTFWPLGMEGSMSQFDTIGVGLTFFSLQDGYFLARNAQTRAEIWRRDDSWILRGLSIGGDALYLGFNIYRAATAKPDPPYNQTIPEFVANPGSVNDFSGRAGKINLMLAPFEYGLSALDASGLAGNVWDEDRTRYFATSGVAAGLGLLGFIFSGAITGNGCASDGPGGASVLLRCGFPAQREKYFKTGIDATPANMQDIETQYVVSTMMAGLTSWGLTRLIAPISLTVNKPGGSSDQDKAKKNAAAIPPPTFNLSAGPQGANLSVSGKF